MNMKKILETLSYNNKTIKRLYVNQFVMSIFSIMVLFASAQNETLLLFASFLAIGIYMFLTYNLMWETGAKKVTKSMTALPQEELLKEGLILVLTASIVNFIGAVSYSVIKIYVIAANITSNATDDMMVYTGNIIWTVIRFIHAMYWGIEALLFPNPNVGLTYGEATIEFAPLLTPPYYFFLTMLPMIIVGTCAYIFGGSDFSILRKFGIDTKHQVRPDINYRNKK